MRRSLHPAVVFAAVFVAIFLAHWPLLGLPYFWDEAGYYVPAARDILIGGSFIPHTTISNAHPPLVLAWVALWWKAFGFAPMVARSAMLVASGFALLGFFRLSERVSNFWVAAAATACTAVYPVFFAQSSLVQVDLVSAGLIFWGLYAYLDDRSMAAALWFSAAALAKETAILAPLALAAWEVAGAISPPRFQALWGGCDRKFIHRLAPLVAPVVPLAVWFAYHFIKTGYVFGNPEFFRYNVAATINPVRFLLALALRLWQSFGYMHLWLLTLGMLIAMLLPPVQENNVERPRISIPVQLRLLMIVFAYTTAMALIGGAVLARYMLPAVPLVILLAVSTLWRRLRAWPIAIAIVLFAFVTAWFWNPPYGFSPEDNLAYRDFVTLHQDAERFLEARYPMARVLTAWPASDELSRPWLGYITRPLQVFRIEDFSLEQVISAADFRQNYDVALVFSTKYDPPHPFAERILGLFPQWQTWKRDFFGYHRDLPPAAIAHILGGHVVFAKEQKGQWAAVIEMDTGEIRDASNSHATLRETKAFSQLAKLTFRSSRVTPSSSDRNAF